MSLRASLTRTTLLSNLSRNSRRNFHSSLPTMGVTVITSYDHFKEVIKGPKPVIIDAWATWCGPCKMISPIFEKISETPTGEKIDFYKVDVDEQEQVSQELGIRAMPTFIFFKNGEKVDSVLGADPAKLQAAVTKLVESA